MTRGIVILCDCEPYRCGTYVLVRLLRHLGCALPVQVWGKPFAALDSLVEWRRPDFPIPDARAGPWKLRADALLRSGFDEVISLDSDVYPVRNPEEVFGWPQYAGCLVPEFWKRIDWEKINIKPASWQALGLEPREIPGFDTYFMAIDVTRNRQVLEQVRAAELHPLLHGECHLFQVAFEQHGLPYATMPDVRYSLHSQIVHDFGGQPMLVHRFLDKFRLTPHDYYAQQCSSEMVRHPELPNEDVCFGFLQDYAAIVGHVGAVPGFPHFADDPGPPWQPDVGEHGAPIWTNAETGAVAYRGKN